MRNSVEILVIGAGIAGASAARALARAGRKVLMISRGSGIGEASPAAAGMLAAQTESTDQGLLPLMLAARSRHDELARELQATGLANTLEGGGIVQVALDDAQAALLQATGVAQRAAGLGATWISRDELHREFPGLAPAATGALVADGDARVDNVALGKALTKDALKAGAMMEFAAAEALLADGATVRGARTSAGERRAETVVIAAGAWSPKIGGLPRALPIEPVRGQMIRTKWPESLPRRVYFGPGGYIVPRGEDALLGSTMERVGFDSGTTAEGIAAIRREVTAVVPGMADAPVIAAWAGLRPLTPDGRPILGADPDMAGLFYCTGHGRNGILLGPLTGEIVAGLIVRGESTTDLKPYGVERFHSDPRSPIPDGFV